MIEEKKGTNNIIRAQNVTNKKDLAKTFFYLTILSSYGNANHVDSGKAQNSRKKEM